MKKYNKFLSDNDKLKSTRTKHLKEIEGMQIEGDWDAKKDAFVEELRTTKTQARDLYYSNMEKKKLLINKHENVIMLDKKIRKMQKLLELKRKEKPDIQKEEQNTEEIKLEDLSDKVKEATQLMAFEEKKMQIEIDRQNAEINNMEHEVEI